MRPSLGVLVAVGLAWLPDGAGAVTAGDVAQRLREKITGTGWEVQNLEITVVPYSDRDTNAGRFRTITVRADYAAQAGIAMRPMYVKGADVVLDMGKLFGPEFTVDTKYRGQTEIYVVLYENDLNKGLRLAQKVVPDLTATLQSGLITLTGTYKFVMGNKFRMSGKLQVVDGSRINFVPTAAKVNGIPIPVSGVKILLSRLNPILDLSEVIMQPRLTSLTVEDGKLVGRG
jgi:hypothetical protein